MKNKITLLALIIICFIFALSLIACNENTVNEVEKYTISFTGGDNATGIAPQTSSQEEGTKIFLPKNPFTKTGYTFDKWSDGTSTYLSEALYPVPANNVIFTAVWKERALISYIVDQSFDEKIMIGNFSAFSNIVINCTYDNNEQSEQILDSSNIDFSSVNFEEIGNYNITINYLGIVNTISILISDDGYYGQGTESAPYLIYTCSQFAALHELTSATTIRYFKVMKDLDFNERGNFTSLNKGNICIEGNNKTISNISQSGCTYSGLFGGYNIENITIKNLNIDSMSITSSGYTGIFIGLALNCVIENCTANNCEINATDTYGQGYLGGFVAWANGTTTITDCSVNVNVRAHNKNYKIGAYAGRVSVNSMLTNCSASGNFAINSELLPLLDVYENTGTIINCVNTTVGSSYN